MIKLGLKNYFKSYRLFFLPIGALSLGIVIGLSIFLPALLGAVKDFFSGAAGIIGDIKPNWDAVWETIASTFRAVDYSDMEAAFYAIFNRGFFGDLLKDCIHAAIDFDVLQGQFQELLSTCAAKALTGGVIFVVFTVLGALVGVFATRVEIRRNIAKRKFWKFVMISIVHTVINATIIACGAWLIARFEKYAVLSGLLTFLLYGAVAFFEAYLVHGYKRISLKKVLRVRNLLSLAVLSVIEVVIMCAFILFVLWISNVVVTLFVGFAVVVLTFSCLSLNAEAYVKDLVAASDKEAQSAQASLPVASEESAVPPELPAATSEGSAVSEPPAENLPEAETVAQEDVPAEAPTSSDV